MRRSFPLYICKKSIMALSLKQRIFSQYPIPYAISIWGGDGISTFPLEDFNVFLETCIDELASDLCITDYMRINSMQTFLPSDTVGVVSAKLDFSFQGNRNVKVTYNAYNKSVNCRYYPAVVTYRRRLSMANVGKLTGDQLQFLLDFCLYKMADKEITTLGSVQLNADNGAINLEALTQFRDSREKRYEERKAEILIYSVGN